MNRNDCEAVLHLHRNYRPRRRTGRGFLVGVTFLDAALLFTAFVLATSPFVLSPGIRIDLPVAKQTDGVRMIDRVLTIAADGRIFFNDEQLRLGTLESALRRALLERPGSALILEADQTTPQATLAKIYDTASIAGYRQIFISTQSPAPAIQPAP